MTPGTSAKKFPTPQKHPAAEVAFSIAWTFRAEKEDEYRTYPRWRPRPLSVDYARRIGRKRHGSGGQACGDGGRSKSARRAHAVVGRRGHVQEGHARNRDEPRGRLGRG